MTKILSLFIIVLFIILGIYIFQQYRPSPLLNPITYPAPQALPSISAWGPWWDQPAVLTSLASASANLASFSPSWHRLNSNLQIETIPSVAQADFLSLTEASGTPIIPTVGNDLDGERVSRFLGDAAAQDTAIAFLVSEAVTNRYAGFDLDFESIPTEDRDRYTQFLRALHSALLENNLLLTVAVHARTGSPNDWNLAQSHDYQEIGVIADQVRIMAYDFHYAGSPPGPITPNDKMEAVIHYAQKTLPPEKIVLGLPLYGYDWVGEKGESVVYQTAVDRIKQYSGSLERDPQSQEMVGHYVKDGEPHELWFQDAQSVRGKIAAAQKLGVNNFIFWRLGGEDPTLWQRD